MSCWLGRSDGLNIESMDSSFYIFNGLFILKWYLVFILSYIVDSSLVIDVSEGKVIAEFVFYRIILL